MSGGVLVGDCRPPGGITNPSARGIVKEATIRELMVLPFSYSVSSGPAPQSWERGVETYISELYCVVASILLNERNLKPTLLGW